MVVNPYISKSTFYQNIKGRQNGLLCVVKQKCEICCRASKTAWERRQGLWPGKTTSHTAVLQKKKKIMSITKNRLNLRST
jgi:hypothetical protein